MVWARVAVWRARVQAEGLGKLGKRLDQLLFVDCKNPEHRLVAQGSIGFVGVGGGDLGLSHAAEAGEDEALLDRVRGTEEAFHLGDDRASASEEWV
jgi:hypothetical protein